MHEAAPVLGVLLDTREEAPGPPLAGARGAWVRAGRPAVAGVPECGKAA